MTYIITWSKEDWPEQKMQELMDRFHKGEETINRWKFGAHRKCSIGDRIFLSKTGNNGPGLLGSGRIISQPRREPDFKNLTKVSWYVDVHFDFLSKSTANVIASKEELASKLGIKKIAFTPRKSGTSFPGNAAELEKLWSKLIGKSDLVYPDEISVNESSVFTEGAKKTVTINRYERDRDARNKCLEVHGSNCKVCGINLGIVYDPELGKDYIHIHHLLPLSEIGKEYIVDPINDLIPICPNCHTMIHQTNPPMSIDKLKNKILPRYLDFFK